MSRPDIPHPHKGEFACKPSGLTKSHIEWEALELRTGEKLLFQLVVHFCCLLLPAMQMSKMSFSTSCVLLQPTHISRCRPGRGETHTHTFVELWLQRTGFALYLRKPKAVLGGWGQWNVCPGCEGAVGVGCTVLLGWEEGLAMLQQLSSPATPSQVTSLTHHTELCCKMQPSAFLCLHKVSKHSTNTAGVPHCSGKTAGTSSTSRGCTESIEQNPGPFGSLLL